MGETERSGKNVYNMYMYGKSKWYERERNGERNNRESDRESVGEGIYRQRNLNYTTAQRSQFDNLFEI